MPLHLLPHTNSQLMHQRRFALVRKLDKVYQQLTKNISPGSKQIFGVDLHKRIQGIKTIKENKLFKPKKGSKASIKNLETITRKGINSTKAASTTTISRQSLQTKGKIPKETQLSVGAINIEEKIKNLTILK